MTASSARWRRSASMAGAHIPRGIQARRCRRIKSGTSPLWPSPATPWWPETCWVPCRRRPRCSTRSWSPPHGRHRGVGGRGRGEYTIRDVIAKVRLADGSLKELTMVQKWPVRVGRPYRRKFPPLCAASDRPAGHRHPVPHCQGRHRRRSRSLRLRGKRWCSTSWPSGRTWTSWSTSAAASAATR